MTEPFEDLALGAEALELLLPHRRPLLMIDRVTAFRPTPRPALRAYRNITANEPIFAGHFPRALVWPGIYTQEGLGQASAVMAVLLAIGREAEAAGQDPRAVRQLLVRWQAAHRFEPLGDFEPVAEVVRAIRASRAPLGVTAAVDLKFLHPVFAGDRLDYYTELSHYVGDMLRFEVEARVASRVVVRGVLTASIALSLAPEL